MADASTCHYLVPGVGLLDVGVRADSDAEAVDASSQTDIRCTCYSSAGSSDTFSDNGDDCTPFEVVNSSDSEEEATQAEVPAATTAVAEEAERRPQRDAWNMNVDDAMAYGRRASIFSPRGAPRGAPESPLAMRTKAAANGLATPTSFATPASFRTGQPKPKVGSAEWMQTVDKARRSTQLAYADSGRSSAKRLEF